ncbi:MAG: hypothetical protein ACPH9K_08270, partial [Candidatus Poseidoniaceae archaeon]
IPMDYVNDGEADCAGGEDEMDMGGSDDDFMCDDGETIPMDYVNDGEADCAGGEDEGYVWTYNYDNCADSDDGLSSLDCWTNEMDVDGDGIPEDSDSYWNYECEQLADGTWECGTDHINYYDNCMDDSHDSDLECWLNEWDTDNDGSYDLGSDGYMDYECEQLADGSWACAHSDVTEMFQIYDNCNEESSMYECWNDDWVDSDGNVAITDGYELGDCSELADGTWECLTWEDAEEDGSPSPQELLDLTDTDSSETMTMDEFNTYMGQDGEEIPQEMIDEFNLIFDEADSDDSGDLDIDELEQFIMDIDEYMMSMEDSEEMFMCDDGEMIPMDYVNDGDEDCSDGSDETDMHDGNDEGGHGHGDDSDEVVMYITSEMDFHFEGDMSDYKIELATCDYDYDMDTGEEMKTCTTVMSVAINDAGMDSDIMFHDADSSGTISVGDMIHIGETAESWDEV